MCRSPKGTLCEPPGGFVLADMIVSSLISARRLAGIKVVEALREL